MIRFLGLTVKHPFRNNLGRRHASECEPEGRALDPGADEGGVMTRATSRSRHRRCSQRGRWRGRVLYRTSAVGAEDAEADPTAFVALTVT
jgi:hypothetical protein